MEGNEKLEKWIQCLTQASQLAYVEGAQGTARLLGCMQRLARYSMRSAEWAPFSEEWERLKDLVEIRRGLFGERIRLYDAPDTALFVPCMSLVEAVGEIGVFDAPVEDASCEIDVIVQHKQDTAKGCILLLTVRKTTNEETVEAIREWKL